MYRPQNKSRPNRSGPRPVPESHSPPVTQAPTAPAPVITLPPNLVPAGVNPIAHAHHPFPPNVLGNGGGLGLGGVGGLAGQGHLVLVLNDNLVEREVYYKIRPSTKLGKLMRFHCQMMGQTLAWTRFVVIERGVYLNQTDTAAEMGIVDGDHIMVIFHSYSMVSQDA